MQFLCCDHNIRSIDRISAQISHSGFRFYILLISVRFTGSIKENDDPVMPLDEIWHFRQFVGNPNWVVGGIQQE
jgi:predicted lipid-binding transport protein (Tim44 family)